MMGFDGLSSYGQSIWIWGVPCPGQGVSLIGISFVTVNPVVTDNPMGQSLPWDGHSCGIVNPAGTVNPFLTLSSQGGVNPGGALIL